MKYYIEGTHEALYRMPKVSFRSKLSHLKYFTPNVSESQGVKYFRGPNYQDFGRIIMTFSSFYQVFEAKNTGLKRYISTF